MDKLLKFLGHIALYFFQIGYYLISYGYVLSTIWNSHLTALTGVSIDRVEGYAIALFLGLITMKIPREEDEMSSYAWSFWAIAPWVILMTNFILIQFA